MQGRGHDLQNLTSYDLNKINAEHRRSGNSRLVGLMSSANFHAYLRNHVTQIPLVMVLFKTNTRLPKEVLNTKKDELFELLQRKRRQHICNLESVKIVRLHIPTFDTEHIKTFIHGGQDPLSDFLMDAQNEENAQHAALMDTRRLQQAKGRNSRFKKGLNNERICLLLQSIDVEDITILALSVAAKSVDAKTLLVRTSVAMKSFSVSMSVSSKMAGEVSAGDVESVATNDGNNKLALALASANKAYQEAVGPQGSAHPSWEAGRQSPKSCKSPRSPKGSLPRKKIDSFGTSVSARETGGSKEVYFKDADTMMRPATPPKKPAGSAHMVSPQKARRQSASLFKPL